jgi:hypothetical protein
LDLEGIAAQCSRSTGETAKGVAKNLFEVAGCELLRT